jgi:creatinine amidohydrolase
LKKYRYADLTWPEIKEYSKQNRVVIFPIGMIEDHGPHLPVDSDSRSVEEICDRVGKTAPDEVLVIPTLPYGFSPHHMDFPGPLTIRGNLLTEVVFDVCKSLIHHGFHKIALVNNHGSNGCWLEAAARMVVVEHPDTQCAKVDWWTLREFKEAFAKVRESEAPGGVSHACEIETSLYLYLRPEMVDMKKAVKDISFPKSDHFWFDMAGTGPGGGGKDSSAFMMEYWSTLSKTGIMGDATKGTAEKGKIILDSIVEGIVNVVRELRDRPIRQRVDHH